MCFRQDNFGFLILGFLLLGSLIFWILTLSFFDLFALFFTFLPPWVRPCTGPDVGKTSLSALWATSRQPFAGEWLDFYIRGCYGSVDKPCCGWRDNERKILCFQLFMPAAISETKLSERMTQANPPDKRDTKPKIQKLYQIW